MPLNKKNSNADESGIRTHAPEETRSLVWRLRPLGHLAFINNGARYLLVECRVPGLDIDIIRWMKPAYCKGLEPSELANQ